MSNNSVWQRTRSADLHSKLRLAALAAVMVGVVLLAAAAFVLSYKGIHQIALRAGVSAGLAKLYPLIFDAMLVISAAAALALRGADLWARCYAWASLLIVLVALAAGNALYATGTTLSAQPTKAVVAVTPWVLLLMAFGLLLEMLRYFRANRSAAAKATAAAAAATAAGNADAAGDGVSGGPPSAVTLAATTASNKAGVPAWVDLDTLLGPKTGQPPLVEVPHDTGAGDKTGHQADPLSHGEKPGYVHPDSYLHEGEYSPHGDTGGPGSSAGQAGDGTYLAGNGATAPETSAAPAEATATPATTTRAETPAASTPTAAAPAAATAAQAETAAATAEAAAASAETPATTSATPAEAPPAPAPTTAPPAEATTTSVETPATSPSAAATPAGLGGTAEAGPGSNRVTEEAAGAEVPALERIRSTPTPPE